MIVKTTFRASKIFESVRYELSLALLSSLGAYVLVVLADLSMLALPVALATVQGTALSILLAVRANTTYQRWWEASGIWTQAVALSRSLVRVVVTVTDAKVAAGTSTAETARKFQQLMARTQVAWAHALRMTLRRQDDWASLASYLDTAEHAALMAVDNKPAMLLQLHSRHIFAAYGQGLLTGFDNFQMENALSGLSVQQALAERMKAHPVPRPYSVFSRMLVHLYVVLFPFSIIASIPAHRWMVVPATLVVAFGFRIIDGIAQVDEAPFDNTIQDVPMTAMCTTIERDLFEQAGIPDRPPAPQPVDGYLY